MTAIVIEVTQEDIDKAIDLYHKHSDYSISNSCPVALAFQRIVGPDGWWAYVAGGVDTEDAEYHTIEADADRVYNFVKAFDYNDYASLKPITFTVEPV